MFSSKEQIKVANDLKAIRDDTEKHIKIKHINIIFPFQIINSDISNLYIDFNTVMYIFKLIFCQIAWTCQTSRTIFLVRMRRGWRSCMGLKRSVELFDNFTDISCVEIET